MRLFSSDGHSAQRELLLLAPNSLDSSLFSNVDLDSTAYQERLAEAQKLRGQVYLEVGALSQAQLTDDGRHVQAADDHSWHLLTLDSAGRVAACARYFPHEPTVKFEDLAVSKSALATSDRWGKALRHAVEADLREARRRGCYYVEVGGWAMSRALRCTSEALRTIASAYAFARMCGGGLGITTASTRSCSAAILKRVGGQRLHHANAELPIYYEEQYHDQLEILRFDALRPNPRYCRWIEACLAHLRDFPVICRGTAEKGPQVELAYNGSLRMNFAAIAGVA